MWYTLCVFLVFASVDVAGENTFQDTLQVDTLAVGSNVVDTTAQEDSIGIDTLKVKEEQLPVDTVEEIVSDTSFADTGLQETVEDTAMRPLQPNWKAMGISLVLPSLSAFMYDRKIEGYVYGAVETCAWLAVGFCKWREGRVSEDARLYAIEYAGASSERKDALYLNAMEWFPTWEEYDAWLRAKARSLYPEDLSAQQAYIDSYYIDPEYAWDWGDTTYFYEYRDIRYTARGYATAATYAVGVAIVQRIVSALLSAGYPKDNVEFESFYDPAEEKFYLGWNYRF